MKVSAALQLLSAVMSSGPSKAACDGDDDNAAVAADQWLQMQMQMQNDVSNHDVVTVRTDLDLGACLDVGALEELSQTLYSDADSCPSQTVLAQHDNHHYYHNHSGGLVIDTTSYGGGGGEGEEEEEDLTSSGDHAGIVPSSEVSIPFAAGHAQMQSLASSTGSDVIMNFAGLGGNVVEQQGLAMSDDNASFLTLQSMAAQAATTTVDFSQFSALGLTPAAFAHSNSSTTTTATIISSPSTTTTTTVDLTSLERLMTMDVDTTTTTSQSVPSLDNSNSFTSEGSVGGNLPSSLWNLDLTTTSSSSPSTGSSGGGDFSLPSSSSSGGGGSVGVKESLRSRLYSRSSVASTSQDNDLNAAFQPFQPLSTRSSSASSLTQSFDDDDDDSDSKTDLEKREKNRLAAQKCRNKKKDKTESLEKDVSRLQNRRERLKEEVQKLRDERETLEQIIDVHGMVCPKMRKTSNNNS